MINPNKNTDKIHSKNLDKLVQNMQLIDEDINHIDWIMREGIYFHNNSNNQKKLCDILVGYHNKEGLCIELKRSNKNEEKAILQLLYGKELMEKLLGYNNIRGKVVYYGTGTFKYNSINLYNEKQI
jgi:hypothetical protein